MYNIEFKNSVKKDLKNIDKGKVKTILEDIESLKSGIDGKENIIKLKGNNPYYGLELVITELFLKNLMISLLLLLLELDIEKKYTLIYRDICSDSIFN